jgi:hypothetical protein
VYEPSHRLQPRLLRRLLLLACALSAGLFFAAGIARAADEIHWTIMGQTAVTIDWRGSEATVRYGLTPALGQVATGVEPSPLPFSSAGPFREARITGLAENTLYYYSVGQDGGTFRTPPARGTADFDVCVAGDVGDSVTYRWVAGVHRQIADLVPRFTLLVGDLTYGNAHGQAAVDRHFNDMMVWSRNAGYMPAWGNHEWDSPAQDDLRNYKGRFDLPNPRTSPGSPAVSCCGEDWYWFDYGNARFIAYPEPWSGAWSAWKTSADSLMAAVKTDPAIQYIVTFGHRPAYSSAHHPGDATLKGYLDALGLKHPKYVLNLNGHSHDYERTHPQQGVVHITAGDGGSSHEIDGSCKWLMCTQPSWSAFRAFRHGPLRLRFTHSGIEGIAMCGPADPNDDLQCTLGSTFDSFVIPAPVTVADATRPATTTNLTVRP